MLNVATRRRSARLPAYWPAGLHPQVLDQLGGETPYLICDLRTLRDRYARLVTAFPNVRMFYAVKCNPAPEVLQALAQVGASFEVASLYELDMLRKIGIDCRDVIYSNTVKPSSHVAGAHERGLWRFAADSEGELYKLARHAPGSSVYLRITVDDSHSRFPLSNKFGAEPAEAVRLMLLARELQLQPYGLTFHVGSQSTDPAAWTRAIAASGKVMAELAEHGIHIDMLDLGGGVPARYGEDVPILDDIAAAVARSLDQLPYRPRLLSMEPGRAIAGEAAVMVATILAREERSGSHWLYLDVGAYNGLMETQQLPGWRYPLWTSRSDHGSGRLIPYTVTGPSCDSSDTMFVDVELPADLAIDDRIYIGSTGAYTLSYASSFNGFPPPEQRFIGGT
jgi:ornithine decarboxylase